MQMKHHTLQLRKLKRLNKIKIGHIETFLNWVLGTIPELHRLEASLLRSLYQKLMEFRTAMSCVSVSVLCLSEGLKQQHAKKTNDHSLDLLKHKLQSGV
jgi:hypothetical protein